MSMAAGWRRCVERCWPSTLQARRSETPKTTLTRSTQLPRQALQRSLQASVFGFQLLEVSCRGDLPTGVLKPPSIEGLLANPDLAAGFGDGAALRNSYLGLAELVEHLFRRMLPLCQMPPPMTV